METRIPASERTSQKLSELLTRGVADGDARAELLKLAVRKIIEEALEAEVSDALGRRYYESGAEPGRGYRNGYRRGRLHAAEGPIEYGVPQVADRAEPFVSRIRAARGGALRVGHHGGRAEDPPPPGAGNEGGHGELHCVLRDLKRRGLPDPLLVVTDGAPGLIRAVETCFPRALRQRCLVHRLRNLRSKAPERLWPEIAARARGCYTAPSSALAAVLRDDFDACTAHLRFPLRHRRVICTTNLLERLFLEERRRAKLIPHAFGERAVLKLMFAAVIRAADRWRGIQVGEFEQRQLRAIRDELNRAHAQRIAPAVSRATFPVVQKLRK